MPNLGSWVAPTLSVEELDKRIEELKNVLFWLEQNSRALSATIQALEVQRMTLATLKGMNFNLSEMARAFTPQGADSAAQATPKPAEKPAEKIVEPAPPAPREDSATDAAAGKTQPGGMVDPLQLWGSLTQQFQQIAATALQEVSNQASLAKSRAAGSSKAPSKAAAAGKKVAAKKAPARKRAASKTTARKTTRS
jgi:hypothetical protein